MVFVVLMVKACKNTSEARAVLNAAVLSLNAM
jgi:hypothetical protein